MNRLLFARAIQDLTEWNNSTERNRVDFDLTEYHTDNEICGTICCALGYLGLQPYWHEQGFHTDSGNIQFEKGDSQFECRDAACALFELPWKEIKRLFYPQGYKSTYPRLSTVISRMWILYKKA